MNDEQNDRIRMLREGPWCPFSYLLDLSGLDLQSESEPLRLEFELWMKSRGNPPFDEKGWINRYWLESFLQNRQLASKATMALSLGMTLASLEGILAKLTNAGLTYLYHKSSQVIGTGFEDSAWGLFADLRDRSPGSHDSLCRLFHEQVRTVLEVPVKEEWCRTAQALGEKGVYAKYRDAITLEPVSPQYSEWLDFGKWLSLAPDRCSILTYARASGELRMAGSKPPIVPGKIATLLGQAV